MAKKRTWGTLNGVWVPHQTRDTVVDYVHYWKERAELPAKQILRWMKVSDELRKLARNRMSREPSDHTLQATALVHEAYLRLVGDEQSWKGRAHFFGAASEAMRRILVESARRRVTAKRGGGHQRDPGDVAEIATPKDPEELLAIHEALDELEKVDLESAELVKLRYFVGLSVDEAAECLGISPRKATYVWAYARKWLRVHLSTD